MQLTLRTIDKQLPVRTTKPTKAELWSWNSTTNEARFDLPDEMNVDDALADTLNGFSNIDTKQKAHVSYSIYLS